MSPRFVSAVAKLSCLTWLVLGLEGCGGCKTDGDCPTGRCQTDIKTYGDPGRCVPAGILGQRCISGGCRSRADGSRVHCVQDFCRAECNDDDGCPRSELCSEIIAGDSSLKACVPPAICQRSRDCAFPFQCDLATGHCARTWPRAGGPCSCIPGCDAGGLCEGLCTHPCRTDDDCGKPRRCQPIRRIGRSGGELFAEAATSYCLEESSIAGPSFCVAGGDAPNPCRLFRSLCVPEEPGSARRVCALTDYVCCAGCGATETCHPSSGYEGQQSGPLCLPSGPRKPFASCERHADCAPGYGCLRCPSDRCVADTKACLRYCEGRSDSECQDVAWPDGTPTSCGMVTRGSLAIRACY